MPMIDLTYPEGALPEARRESLVEDLTTVLLRAERAPDTEFFRSVTWVYLHELPAHAVCAGDRPVSEPTFRVEVRVPEGALSPRRKEELVAAATGAVREAAGLDEAAAMRVWVLIAEVPEGNWGAAGNVVAFEQLRAAAAQQREAEAAQA